MRTKCLSSVCRTIVSSRLERKGKKRSPLNPFNRPQTRTNRPLPVSKNRRLTGGTTPCPRRDKGARAIRLVGKDQKEGRKEEVKILFFPYRTYYRCFAPRLCPPVESRFTCGLRAPLRFSLLSRMRGTGEREEKGKERCLWLLLLPSSAGRGFR